MLEDQSDEQPNLRSQLATKEKLVEEQRKEIKEQRKEIEVCRFAVYRILLM